MGKATDAIGRRNEELKKAANYARGGIMPVVGAGTGTSDSVPVVVAGQDVRLSNGEAAILPARTMKNPAAVQAVEGIIEATNGKPPVRGRVGWPTAGFSASRTRPISQESGAPGTASRRRTPGHPSGLLPLQQRFLRRLNPFPRSQFRPDADDEHHQEREQLFGGAAFAIFAGVDVAGPVSRRPRHWLARRLQSSRPCHLLRRRPADYRRLRQRSGADTAVSETTR